MSRQMLKNIEPEITSYGPGYSNWASLMLKNIYPFYELIVTGNNVHEIHKQLTQNYYLRDILESDLEPIFLGLSHPEVIKYYGISYSSFEETKTQMQWFKNLEISGSGKWFAICNLKTDEFLGAGGLNDLIEEHQKAEIGLWLLPQFWGKGILQEVMPKIVAYGFN